MLFSHPMGWPGTVGGVLTRGLITLAVSTVSIDLPQYTNSIFLTTVLWVMGDERVSFGILLLAFSRFFVSHSVCRRAVCWR